jgi:predicted glycosyltransferase
VNVTGAIWIDVDNSPHVPLFVPIIKRCQRLGRTVILTARHHSQTVELLENAGLEGAFQVIGTHSGKNKLKKILGLTQRAKALVAYIHEQQKRGQRVSVALSHGSRSMVLAAKWLRLPVITMYDYEHTETFIFNTFSDCVMVPHRIPDATLDKIGLKPHKRLKYEGFKEELYLNYYEPDAEFWKKVEAENGITVDQSKVIVTLRPPASTANYHHYRSEELLFAILRKLLTRSDVFTVILPRTPEQHLEIKQAIQTLGLESAYTLIPKRAVNGLDLAHHSDLLISGGGTMNREAALLGVPVYSIFAGQQGALDADMEACGMIRFIRTLSDINQIELKKRPRSSPSYRISTKVEDTVIQLLSQW